MAYRFPSTAPLDPGLLAAVLTQEVYPILAGYPDFNDAQALRGDPLFQEIRGAIWSLIRSQQTEAA